MLGRTPDDITAVQPVRCGQIEDWEVAEGLLLHLIRKVHGRSGWMSPRMVVTIPWAATEMERRAARECCEAAGARDVRLVPRPLAAALGAHLPVREASGHLVVDVGGGATEITVLSLGGIVCGAVVPGGGEGMDRAVADHVREAHDLLVGPPSAERLKIELGCALPGQRVGTAWVKGRCMREGVPRAVDIHADEIVSALAPCVRSIADAVRQVIERAPPELGSDILDHGIVLVGGGSRLDRLDTALREATGIPVVVAENPDLAVIAGAGEVLEELDLLQAMAS
jgi:rod shape-determining protein MreB and related proteins